MNRITRSATTRIIGPVADVAGRVGEIQIGAKGRFVLPVAVRRAADLEDGSQLVAVPLGRGRVLLETVDAARERVWAGVPDPDSSVDPVMDVRRMRKEDIAISDEAAARRRDATASHSHLLDPKQQ